MTKFKLGLIVGSKAAIKLTLLSGPAGKQYSECVSHIHSTLPSPGSQS